MVRCVSEWRQGSAAYRRCAFPHPGSLLPLHSLNQGDGVTVTMTTQQLVVQQRLAVDS